MEPDLQLPELGLKVISVTLRDGEPPTYDLGGVDPWAANNILLAIATELWDELPSPVREGH